MSLACEVLTDFNKSVVFKLPIGVVELRGVLPGFMLDFCVVLAVVVDAFVLCGLLFSCALVRPMLACFVVNRGRILLF